MTTEPSARVTVNEKPMPGVNTDELTSEANTKKPPPSATAKLTVPVPALSSAPSRLAAAPRAQFAVAGSVSQTPPPLAVCRSSSRVTVRAPLPAPRVTRKVPSSALSALRAELPCPTLSRSVPRNARLIAGAKVGAKVAVTVVAAESVTTHVPVPLQPPPLQPLKVEPMAGMAVSITTVPLAKLAEQVAPQVMPAGALVTVPLPVPAGVTVSVKVWSVNVAVTVVAAETVTTHDPVPVHPPPLHPLKIEPAAGVAVSVTAVPPVK